MKMKTELEKIIEHVNISFEKAENNTSKISQDILNIEGMSGNKTRHLYNNICSLDGANYLEIGTWKGSSFISSLYGNNINAIAIDNWVEFNGPKNEFLQNTNKFINYEYHFIEKDSFLITDEDITNIFDSIDIYLYDGCHDYESHKNAITYYSKFLSRYSIIIIDDWRNDGPWEKVQRGTYDGLNESGLIIHHKIEKITQQEKTGPFEYWNGVVVFVCEKKK
jgi:hypothetical protein